MAEPGSIGSRWLAGLSAAAPGPTRGPGAAGRFADHGGDGARRAAVRSLARQCGLTGALGTVLPHQGDGGEHGAGSAAFYSLRDAVFEKAWATVDPKRAKTALDWFAAYLGLTGRVPFVPMRHAGDLQAGVYNRETLESFSEYIRISGSRKAGSKGALLASDTVAGYVSAIATLRGIEAHYSVTMPQANVRQPRALKRMRQEDPASGYRSLSKGLRAAQLRKVLELRRVVDLSTLRGAIEGGAVVLAHNLLLRGGEVCCVENKPFDGGRDLTFDAVEFMPPCAESRGKRWLTIDIVAVKDTVVRHRVCPMPVRERDVSGDTLCPFEAVCRLWRARLRQAPPEVGRIAPGHRSAKAPMFVAADGSPWHTGHTRDLARRFALALNLPTLEFGAKAFRIGGATDLQASLGSEGAQQVIKQRGRWASDVAVVYQRALAGVHLDASASIGDAEGRELEALLEGWAQPAQFR
jgi:hypothetical protein